MRACRSGNVLRVRYAATGPMNMMETMTRDGVEVEKEAIELWRGCILMHHCPLPLSQPGRTHHITR